MKCIRQIRLCIKFRLKGWVLWVILFFLLFSSGISLTSKIRTAYAKGVRQNNPAVANKQIDIKDIDYSKTKILIKFKKDAQPKQVLRDLGIANGRVKRTLGDNILAARERKYLRRSKSKKTEYKVQGKKYLSLDKVPTADLARAAYSRLPEKEKALFRWYTVTLAGKEKDIPGLIERIKRHPAVENAQPYYNYIPYGLPNDPYYTSSGSWGQDYADLWNVHKINAALAWAIPVSLSHTPDVNRDGIVNFLDLNLVAKNWNKWGIQIDPKSADINQDWVVNHLDLRLIARNWVTEPPIRNVNPDVNGDGIVNFLDFNLIAKNLGKWFWFYPAAVDINQDKVVNYKDIAILSQRWLRRGNSDGVVVAVVDTGLDYNHKDIFGNVWVNPGEVGDKNGDGVIDLYDLDFDGDRQISETELSLASDEVDGDDNGLTDDLIGWNFNREWDDIPPDEVWQHGDYNDVSGNNNPMDIDGHGTHVAGTIAAVGNNNEGIIGVSPDSQIMALRADPMTDENLVYALYYAGRNGAKVINNSWGPQLPRPSSPVMEDAVEVLTEVYDCVVVFAAGNNNYDVAWYSPNNHEKVITVASTDTEDVKSYFSNYGNLIDVSAPGGNSYIDTEPNTPTNELLQFVNILSLLSSGADANDPDLDIFGVGEGYVRKFGTSMAAPAVSGLAALLRQHHPYDSQEDIRWKVRLGSDDVGSMGKDINTGWGRIDCYESLFTEPQPALTIGSVVVTELVGDGDGKIEVGESAKVVVSVHDEWRDALSVEGTLSCAHPSISIINSSYDFGDIAAGESASNGDMPFTFKAVSAYQYDPGIELTITCANGRDLTVAVPVTIIQINTQLIHDLSPNQLDIFTWLASDGEGNVYLKWNSAYYSDGDPDDMPHGFKVSRDSGYRWDWLMPQTEHLWGDGLICDSAGNVYTTTAGDEPDVGVYSSHDQGLNWDFTSFTDRPNARKHSILADGIGGVYFVSMAGGYQIDPKVYFNYSHDNGYSWSNQINALPDNESVGVYVMDVDNNGNLYHVWFKWGAPFSTVKFNRSLDRGVTWDNSSELIGTYEGAVMDYLVASDDSGHVSVLWQAVSEGPDGYYNISATFVTSSQDYGSTWQAEPILMFSNPPIGTDPDKLEGIGFHADNNGNVYFVGNTLYDPVVFRVSRDYGQTWSEVQEISDATATMLSVDADDEGRIGMIFLHHDNVIYFKYSNDYGETWSQDIQLTGGDFDSTRDVKVVTDGKGIFNCVWVVHEEQIYVSTISVPANVNP